MTKRDDLYAEARRLYVIHGLSRRAIALRLGVSERSLQNWANDNKDGKGAWDEQKAGIIDGDKDLHNELMSLAVVVTRQVKDDLIDGRVDPKQVANLERILKSALKALEHQRKAPPPESDKTPQDVVSKIQGKVRERLGLR